MRKLSRRARTQTITVYNYIGTTAGVAAYQRTQLDRVYLDRDYQQRLAQKGVDTKDTAYLAIETADLTATSGRTFIAPESWAGLSAQDKAKHYTFKNADDFFIAGAPTETLPTTTKVEMQRKYRCYAITSLSEPGPGGATLLEVTAA